MAHMDQAGGNHGCRASARPRGELVAEASDLIRAMRVGDMLEVSTEVESVGSTSGSSLFNYGDPLSPHFEPQRVPRLTLSRPAIVLCVRYSM